jgi:hypothetical protein
MEREGTHAEEEASLSTLEETDGGQGHHQDGRASKLSRFIKVQLYLPLKDVVLVEELRLKLMKQGHDISRSRLVSEAIRHYSKAGADPKIEVRG